MIYLPSEYINSSYKYEILDNGVINVYTTDTCVSPSSSMNSIRYKILTNNNYEVIKQCVGLADSHLLVSNDYNTTTQSYLLTYDKFTDDFWYRNDLSNILIIFLVLFIFCLYMPYRIIARWFGRWLKV